MNSTEDSLLLSLKLASSNTQLHHPAYPALKRATDIAVAMLALLLTGPLLMLMAVFIRCISRGSPFIRVPRIGLDGRQILIWKLRTMRYDADRLLLAYLSANPEAEAEWRRSYKLKHDPRIIPYLGRFLRKSSIDELPQFLDVLAGRMSIVGPRPFPDYHLKAFDPEFRTARSSVLPGLTGLWQIECRNEGGLEEQVYWDLLYLERRSYLFDLSIILRTPLAVLAGRSAY